jgi:hydrogenase maturation factor
MKIDFKASIADALRLAQRAPRADMIAFATGFHDSE